MQADDIEFSSDGIDEIDAMLREGTRIACSTPDFPAALVRFTEAFPTLAPKLYALSGSTDADAQRARCYMLFREIWKRVPRPDHGFRPLPLPKQERNEPCQCGSGRKFKQCCARLDGVLPFDPQGLSLLKYVLEELPASAYEKLPFDHMSPEELAFVAEQWIEEGRADIVTFLLVPLLARVTKLDARHEAAFDILGDAYLQLGMPEQRIELVERVMEAGDPTLRCAALHRRCMIHSDAGEWPAAWKLFAKAEHLQPDNPSLAHLETIMLASEGRTERAQERALYWLTRLGRQGHMPGDDPLMDFLRQMSVDPDAVMAMIRGDVWDEDDEEAEGFPDEDDLDWLMPLVGMLETLPVPVSHYKLRPAHGNAGGLDADQDLAALEQRWAEVFQRDTIDEFEASKPREGTGWIGWLTGNPLAWQSFAILDDVAAFIEETPMDNVPEDTLCAMEMQLLTHAFSLLEAVIAANKAQGCRLEWGWSENRPALRLLENYIDSLDDFDEELRLLEWLVGTLNPDDNQGLRESLARRLIEIGRADDALALCERYPDDGLGAMPYARVLALHRLGRLDEAATALTRARLQRPRFLSALLDANTPAPDLDLNLISAGGDDEAWFYRMDWHHLWSQTGSLDWLKKVA